MVGSINLNIHNKLLSDCFQQQISNMSVSADATVNTGSDEFMEDLLADTGIDPSTLNPNELDAGADAIVSGITSYVEGLFLTIISSGTANLLDKIGINKENIELALFITNVAGSAIAKIESILPFIPKNITMIPDAKGTLSVLTTSFKDMYMAMYLKVELAYQETIVPMITNFPSWEEIQKDAINVLIDVAYQLIDLQCYKYTGKTLVEIYLMCLYLYTIYINYKELQKLKRELELYEAENGITEETEKKRQLITFNSANFKETLKLRLAEATDLIYNCFIIVTIKEAIENVKSLILQMHSIDLKLLANNINSLEDLIQLLDDIGLNENAWTVSIAEAIELGINDFHNQVNALTKLLTAFGISTAAGIAADVIDNTNLNLKTEEVKLFDFQVKPLTEDGENKLNNIYLNIYSDPLTLKFKNRLNNVLLNAKVNDTNVFNTGQIVSISNAIEKGYQTKQDLELFLGTYKLTIHFEMSGFIGVNELRDEKQQITSQNIIDELNQEMIRSMQDALYRETELNQLIINDFLNDVTKEEFTQDPIRTKRRPTLKLLHDLLAIINKFLPLFKVLATLISNYKVNKAKAEANALGNIFAMIKFIAKVNKLLSSVNTTNKNFYTIRTLKLYDYISNNIITISTSQQTIDLNIDQTKTLYTYLMNNNLDYRSLNTNNNTVLYIDTESLNKQREERDSMLEELNQFFGEDSSLFVSYPKTDYNDGTTLGLDKVEIAGNLIYYSNSSLPMIGSLILRALNNHYNPNE